MFDVNTKTTYTLTYNANGGSVSPGSKTLNKGAQYGNLPTPTRSGYTFNGWYTQASGGSKVSSSTTINANTTIYAHWKKNSTPSHTLTSLRTRSRPTRNPSRAETSLATCPPQTAWTSPTWPSPTGEKTENSASSTPPWAK